MASHHDVIDLLVVGGGTAGIVGAKTASRLGARTVLVERGRTGGDCLWTGCVPSKTLLSAAERSASERTLTGRGTDFATVRARIAEAITAIEPEDSPQSLRETGVTVLFGTARFTAPGEADLEGRTLRFRQALIATGSAPTLPPIPGLQAARTVTSETVWDLAELPGRLLVVGGGPVGCELGQAFARLGSRVVLLARSGILTRENRDAAALVRDQMTADGVRMVEGVGAERVDAREGGAGSRVRASDGQEFDADVVLVATGRTPRTEGLGLEAVGVDCDSSGRVVVGTTMRTSQPTIWAAGDVTPYPDFTHLAGVHASTAAINAVLGLRSRISSTVPRVTYTSPELASVGLTEPAGKGHAAVTVHHGDSDRAVTEQRTAGMTRIVVGRRGRILGGTIVGPRAGESLAELTLAVQEGLTTRDLTGVTHPYPTYNDALWNAAIAHTWARLDTPAAGAILKALVRVNRWRVNAATMSRSPSEPRPSPTR